MARSGAAAARRAHNPKVVGSNPTSATNLTKSPEPGSPGSFAYLERREQEEAGGSGEAPDQEAQAEGSGTGGALGFVENAPRAGAGVPRCRSSGGRARDS